MTETTWETLSILGAIVLASVATVALSVLLAL